MSETVRVKFEKLHPDVVVPSYKHEGDSGMDVRAFFHDDWVKANGFKIQPEEMDKRAFDLHAGSRTIIPTGIKVAIPDGYEIQVRPRSGMAVKQGLTVLNTPGTVDAGYRGEIGIIVYNSNIPNAMIGIGQAIRIEHGDRIAQLVLQKVPKVEWEFVDSVDDDSTRGEGGFGSTGQS
jgi:dUTP pyrophosphatase